MMSESMDAGEVPQPVRWRDLLPDEAAQVWRQLDDWVRWWVARYGVSTSYVPPCWYLHPRLVEELSALWTAWTLWFDSMSPANGPLTWHREAEAGLHRLKATASETSCTINVHHPSRAEAWVTRDDLAAAFEEFVGDEVEGREAAEVARALSELNR